MAGAPKGNKNAVMGKQARQALEIALKNDGAPKQVATGVQCLVDIWNAQIAKAKDGDVQSANMIVDRMDGKPGQSVHIGGELITREKVLTPEETAAISAGLEEDC